MHGVKLQEIWISYANVDIKYLYANADIKKISMLKESKS